MGGFKNIALRKFVKDIKPKYGKNCEFTVVLCSDTDVFELEQKPPVNWKDIQNKILSAGAKTVIMVKARESIEDWFLYDVDNIISFLKLKRIQKYLVETDTISLSVYINRQIKCTLKE